MRGACGESVAPLNRVSYPNGFTHEFEGGERDAPANRVRLALNHLGPAPLSHVRKLPRPQVQRRVQRRVLRAEHLVKHVEVSLALGLVDHARLLEQVGARDAAHQPALLVELQLRELA
jgi:hypothetical protein